MIEISKDIGKVANQIKAGKIAAFPTETVYGLGALASNGQAVAKIYSAKGRPSFNPLITHVNSADDAFHHGMPNRWAKALAAAFWPGPMTLILPKRDQSDISDLALAGLSTIALRVPEHSIARALIEAVGAGLVAPSANKSGRVSPTKPAHVANQFTTEFECILDGGDCSHGLESTIIDLTGALPIICRPGPLSRKQIEMITGPVAEAKPIVNDQMPNAPGQLTSHYAPKGKIRLNSTCPQNNSFFIGFGALNAGKVDFNLSPAGDLIEAAANLFSALHAADAAGAKYIDVAPIPLTDIGEAISDRLARAASPRS